jgi:hypothetical protein
MTDEPKQQYDPATLAESDAGYEEVKEGQEEQEKETEYYAGPEPEAGETPEAGGGAAVKEEQEESQFALPERTDWAAYGLTADQAKALQESGQLTGVLDAMDAQQVRAGMGAVQDLMRNGLPQQQQQQPQRNELGQFMPQQQAQQQQQERQTIDPWQPKTTADYGEELSGDLKIAADRINQLQEQVQQLTSLQGLDSRFQALEAQIAEQASAEFSNRIDSHFNGLPKEYGELFGKGSLAEVPVVQQQARIEVTNVMQALESLAYAKGQQPPSEQQLLKQATRFVASEQLRSVARKEVQQEVEQVRSKFSAQPTPREGRPLSPDERAAKFADSFYDKRGIK